MTDIVLDASVAAAWFLPRQATASADDLRRAAPGHDFHAPSIFPVEVRNLLLASERRGRIACQTTEFALESLAVLRIAVAPLVTREDWDDALDLARAEQLTAYDALYLQLALNRGFALASRDGALLQACGRRGVAALDLRA